MSYGKVTETMVMLLYLGNSKKCTPTFVSEFARIYSLPTHKHDSNSNNFKRYSKWLSYRNKLIKGFTKSNNKYYMVADKRFYHCYPRYGFCSACGILRCSPVWCICGHKELSDGWTSNNKQLDKFIKKSQSQTNSANDAYLEWFPYDFIYGNGYIPASNGAYVEFIPLEITDSSWLSFFSIWRWETRDSYYVEVNYLLMRHVY